MVDIGKAVKISSEAVGEGHVDLDIEDDGYLSDETLYNDGTVSDDIHLMDLENITHNGLLIRFNKTVELIDGDFIRVVAIKKHLVTQNVSLQGHRFRRNRYVNNMLEKKLNEVTWLLRFDCKDCRDISDQSLEVVDLQNVITLRQLFFTNDQFPKRSYREGSVVARSTQEIEDRERLVCRWKLTDFNKHHGSLERLSESDCTPGYHIPSNELRRQFRGVTTGGGDCQGWSPAEQDFERDERQKWIGHDFLNFLDHPISSQPRYTFGDAFCGAGGMSRGAKGAGLRVRWGFDFDQAAIDSYLKNFSAKTFGWVAPADALFCVQDDLRVDILHLSPPCQTFSPAHTRPGKDDDMNSASFFSLESVILKARPRIVTVEETFGLLNHTQWFQAMIQILTRLNFSVRWEIFKLREFGLPQSRKRLLLFASCPGQVLPEFPSPTHRDPRVLGLSSRLPPFRTINQAISGIPDHASLHDPANPQLRRNEEPYDGNTLLKTITCGADRKNNLHPSGNRSFTKREIACLQGFPVWHQFGDKKIHKQIGNAVPPLVAKVFLEAVVRSLRKSDGLLVS